MGRHRKKTTTGRRSALALTGLVPVGIVGVASSGTLSQSHTPVISTPIHESASAAVDIGSGPSDIARQAHSLAGALSDPTPVPPPPVVTRPTPPLPTNMAASPIAVPDINITAYKNAERILATENPTCNMPWTLIAGIGRVESSHANNGKADANGELLAPIYGPALDGSLSGNQVITDGNGYVRAEGPMQFLPETWRKYGVDGNGDGKADPQNLFDAALTTGKYLCDGNLDMRDLGQQNKAILRYNNSIAYVANVMAWELAYSTGVVPPAGSTPRI